MQQVYFVFLRAVNVSGKNIIKMAALKSSLESAGFEAVKTYIQSGNMLLQSSFDKTTVKNKISDLILSTFGLQIEVFVLELKNLENALHQNPFGADLAPNRVFVTLLSAVPDKQLVTQLKNVDHGTELFEVKADILYFYVPDGMAKSKMTNNYFEKKLKVIATGRNLNTIRKMIELAN